MTRATEVGRTLGQGLADDLDRVLNLPPAERVRELGRWLDNSGDPESIRTRLYEIRALAAAEVADASPRDLPGVLGTGRTAAYELAARGRALAGS